MRATSNHYQLTIRNEFDIVTARQMCRAYARSIGLGMTEQAKLTAIISALSSTLSSASQGITITLAITRDQSGAWLSVRCETPSQQTSELYTLLELGVLRKLVETTSVMLHEHHSLLELTMAV